MWEEIQEQDNACIDARMRDITDEMIAKTRLYMPVTIFFRDRHGIRECYCTHCEERYEANRERLMNETSFRIIDGATGSLVTCPHCGKNGILKRANVKRNWDFVYNQIAVIFADVCEDRVWLRKYVAIMRCFEEKDYTGGADSRIRLDPWQCWCLSPGKSVKVETGYYDRKCWHTVAIMENRDGIARVEGNMRHDGRGVHTYFIGYEEAIRNSFLRYLPSSNLDPAVIAAMQAAFPCTEMMLKLGMKRLISEVINDGLNLGSIMKLCGKSFGEIFPGIDKQEFALWKDAEFDAGVLRCYKKFRKTMGKGSATFEEAKIFDSLGYGCWNVSTLKPTVSQLIRGSGLKPGMFRRYFDGMMKMGHDERYWLDYIEAATDLGYDLTRRDVILPKNLEERHDAAVSAREIKANEISMKKWQRSRRRTRHSMRLMTENTGSSFRRRSARLWTRERSCIIVSAAMPLDMRRERQSFFSFGTRTSRTNLFTRLK